MATLAVHYYRAVNVDPDNSLAVELGSLWRKAVANLGPKICPELWASDDDDKSAVRAELERERSSREPRCSCMAGRLMISDPIAASGRHPVPASAVAG